METLIAFGVLFTCKPPARQQFQSVLYECNLCVDKKKHLTWEENMEVATTATGNQLQEWEEYNIFNRYPYLWPKPGAWTACTGLGVNQGELRTEALTSL